MHTYTKDKLEIISLGNIAIFVKKSRNKYTVEKTECSTSCILYNLHKSLELQVLINIPKKRIELFTFFKNSAIPVTTSYGKYTSQEEVEAFKEWCTERGIITHTLNSSILTK